MLAIWYLVEFFSHHQIWPKSGKKYSSFAQVCLILVILKLLLSVLPDLVLYYLLQVLTFIDLYLRAMCNLNNNHSAIFSMSSLFSHTN